MEPAENKEETQTQHAGEEYKISAAATANVDELLNKDADDESLRRYKEQLLGAAAHGDLGDPNDPRRVIVTEFRVIFEEDVPDVVFHLDTPEGIAEMQQRGFVMKEGCHFKFRLSFRVQHEIVAGIKFVNKVRKAVFSNTDELVIGSYPPASTPHVFEFPRNGYNEAPSGMMARGTYHARDQFVDSDGVCHLEYEYDFHIRKTWEA